jgi:hypothetical protein
MLLRTGCFPRGATEFPNEICIPRENFVAISTADSYPSRAEVKQNKSESSATRRTVLALCHKAFGERS